MIAILLSPPAWYVLRLLHIVQLDQIWKSVSFGVVFTVLYFVVAFAWYWSKRGELADPPRTLSSRKQKAIRAVLAPYGHRDYPSVTIFVCQSAKDGMGFASSIEKVFIEAGWRVHAIEEAQCDTEVTGLSIIGNWRTNLHSEWPPLNQIIKSGFAIAGIKINVEEAENNWLRIIVGPRETTGGEK